MFAVLADGSVTSATQLMIRKNGFKVWRVTTSKQHEVLDANRGSPQGLGVTTMSVPLLRQVWLKAIWLLAKFKGKVSRYCSNPWILGIADCDFVIVKHSKYRLGVCSRSVLMREA